MSPLLGTRNITPLIAESPLVEDLATEPWELREVQFLQALFEIDDKDREGLLPAALYPTIPPIVYCIVQRVGDSPIGPFSLATVRIGCRASEFQRGYVTRCYSDSPIAAAELRRRWGLDVREADVRLRVLADRVAGEVQKSGRTILHCELVDPVPISGADVRYVDSLTLARVRRDGEEVPRLVQVDAEYHVRTADRGRPLVTVLDAAEWAVEGLRAVWPIAASFTTGSFTLPKVRYLLDPSRPPHRGGLEAVGGAVAAERPQGYGVARDVSSAAHLGQGELDAR